MQATKSTDWTPRELREILTTERDSVFLVEGAATLIAFNRGGKDEVRTCVKRKTAIREVIADKHKRDSGVHRHRQVERFERRGF